MTNFGFCWNTTIDGVAPVKGLLCARSILGPNATVRTGPDLSVLFADSDPSKADYSKYLQMHANCLDAGLHEYINAYNLPAHVTGGVPGYQTGRIGGAGAQFLFNHGVAVSDIPAVYEAAPLGASAVIAAFPLTIAIGGISVMWLADEFLKHYAGEQSNTWAPDNPPVNGGGGPAHVWGAPGYEAADRLCAPRLFLRDWSKIPPPDLAKVQEMGQRVGLRFPNVRFGGFGNEFGNEYFNIDMRFDGANAPGGPDTVKERLGAVLDAYNRGWWETNAAQTIGFEHDGPGIMVRCEEQTLFKPDYLSYHPYPQDGLSSIEMCRKFWWPEIDKIKAGDPPGYSRGEGIGEIGGDPMGMVLFAADVLRERPQTAFIIFLDVGYFIDGFLSGNPQPKRAGLAMRERVMEHEARRRAVVHP